MIRLCILLYCRLFGHKWAPLSWLQGQWICRRCHIPGRDMPQ